MLRNVRTHLNPASLLAMVALFVALGGISYAAATIDGKSIKNKSVAGKKLKNGAVTNAKVKKGSLSANRLSRSARAALKGSRGPAGPAGPAGPQGVQGVAGPQGVAGTALAYAQISDSTPSLVSARTSGIESVSRPSTGLYCLAPTAAVLPQAFGPTGDPVRPTVASVEFGNTATQTDTLIVEPRGATSTCPDNTFEVRTYRNGALSDTVSFNLIVP